jgi:hypothetical protein
VYIEVRDTVQIISATTVVFAGLLKNPNLETACPIFNLGVLKPIDYLGPNVFYLAYWFLEESEEF